MLGLLGPIALGAATGHLQAGLTASFGGLALSGTEPDQTAREQALSMAYALVAGCLAMAVGGTLAKNSVAVACGIPAVAAAAALLGGMSRQLARATTQLILFAIIATNLAERGARPLQLVLAFALGGIWTAAVALLLGWCFGAAPAGPSPPPRRPSAKVLLLRWWRSLSHLPAYQYATRITCALAAAEAVQLLWPRRHAYWVALTVAIVLRRNIPEAPTLTLQRALGTLLGVVAAAGYLAWAPGLWAAIAFIAALAAVRPVLRAGNYAAYAGVMTPLIILLMDLGQQPSAGAIVERLIATFVGCALVLTFDYLVWSRLFMPPAPK
jgi:hypothetical protein